MTGSPQWSPDSKSLAFDSRVAGRSDIFIASIGGGSPARITNGLAGNSDSVVPTWSHDGRSVYFSSNRTGQWQVWRRSLDSGAETQITSTGGFNGTESEDGTMLYFIHDASKADLWRLSLGSGKSEPDNCEEQALLHEAETFDWRARRHLSQRPCDWQYPNHRPNAERGQWWYLYFSGRTLDAVCAEQRKS
jgi:hypothetical protein